MSCTTGVTLSKLWVMHSGLSPHAMLPSEILVSCYPKRDRSTQSMIIVFLLWAKMVWRSTHWLCIWEIFGLHQPQTSSTPCMIPMWTALILSEVILTVCEMVFPQLFLMVFGWMHQTMMPQHSSWNRKRGMSAFWMSLWQCPRVSCIPCVPWTWRLTDSWLVQPLCKAWWEMVNPGRDMMTCLQAGLPRLWQITCMLEWKQDNHTSDTTKLRTHLPTWKRSGRVFGGKSTLLVSFRQSSFQANLRQVQPMLM